MPHSMKASSSSKKKNTVNNSKQIISVYPMMPRGYTAVQREKLRKFEKELLKGKRIKIG